MGGTYADEYEQRERQTADQALQVLHNEADHYGPEVRAVSRELDATRQRLREVERHLRSWLGDNLPGRLWDERVRELLAETPIIAGDA